jgi:arginine/lysine/ornithine decarboxylase
MHQLEIDGFRADEILHQELGVTAELPLLNHLMFMVTFGNSSADIDKLVAALTTLAQKYYQPNFSPYSANPMPFSGSDWVLSPRDAFFAPSEALPLKETINRISAELVCPYPPGIPVLMPGEIITVEAVEYLQAVIAAGGMVTGCADSSLVTLQVVS